MVRVLVGESDALIAGSWLVVTTPDGRRILVLHNAGEFYAYDSVCPHMGGPLEEGKIMPRVEAILTEDKRYKGERFSNDRLQLVCPWHGWEYDLATGKHAGDPSVGLRQYRVVVEADKVYVDV